MNEEAAKLRALVRTAVAIIRDLHKPCGKKCCPYCNWIIAAKDNTGGDNMNPIERLRGLDEMTAAALPTEIEKIQLDAKRLDFVLKCMDMGIVQFEDRAAIDVAMKNSKDGSMTL